MKPKKSANQHNLGKGWYILWCGQNLLSLRVYIRVVVDEAAGSTCKQTHSSVWWRKIRQFREGKTKQVVPLLTMAMITNSHTLHPFLSLVTGILRNFKKQNSSLGIQITASSWIRWNRSTIDSLHSSLCSSLCFNAFVSCHSVSP